MNKEVSAAKAFEAQFREDDEKTPPSGSEGADFRAGAASPQGAEYTQCHANDGFYDDIGDAPPPDFPCTALYGPIGDITRKLEPECESHIAAIHVPLMCVMGNMFGRTIYRNVSGTRHYPALFTALVGETSANKSSGFDLIKHLVIQNLGDDIWLRWCLRNGSLASGEGAIIHLRNKNDKDDDRVDDRSLFYESELTRVLKAAYRDGNTVSDFLRTAWDGTPLGNMALKNRDAKNNFVEATDYLVSMNAEVNRPVLVKTVRDVSKEDGLVNRFLFAAVPPTDKIRPTGADFTKINVCEEVEALRESLHFTKTHKGTPIEWSDDAKRRWAEIYTSIKRSRDKGGEFQILVARAAPYTLRLAIIYAIADCSLTIEVKHLDAAYALWEYCRESALWAFGHAGLSVAAEKIFHRLTTEPSGQLTLRQISDDVFRRNATSAEIRVAVKELEWAGKVIRLESRSNSKFSPRPVIYVRLK